MTRTSLQEWRQLLSPGVHTVRRMQRRQLAGMGARKSRELLFPRLPVDFDRWYDRHVPADPVVELAPFVENTETLRGSIDDATRDRYRRSAREAASGTPTFLNTSRRVWDGTDVEWDHEAYDDLPALWSMQLYTFQPLSWLVLGVDPADDRALELAATFDGWIRSWIESVEIGRPGYLRREWTPWAVSLRILHWSRYLAWRQRGRSAGSTTGFELAVRRELYKNVLFLRNHVERDVGGNHLVENGAALVAAGCLFGKRPWIDDGIAILSDAATDQYLDDGAHFERSPMYHVLTLTRYLTVCDLLDESGRSVPEALSTTADRATAFLRYLRPPDGRIPLLNDAVYGQALPLDDCLRYADATGVEGEPTDQTGTPRGDDSSPDGTSGYRWLRTGDGALLVDGGPVGPPHLPGHSHSDTLSVLVWLGDRPVLTDTGTYGYVDGPRREYARGVSGHNTVQVGDIEPIPLAGKYLMGPRPEPTTRSLAGPVSLFEGYYEARPNRTTRYDHHRAVYASDGWWFVRDTVRGHDGVPTRGRLHVHPDVDATLEPTGCVRLDLGDGDGDAYVYPLDETRLGVGTGWYFPRFGTAIRRPVVELREVDDGHDPATLGFLLTCRDVEAPAVETTADGGVPRTLQLADDQYQLPRTRLTETRDDDRWAVRSMSK